MSVSLRPFLIGVVAGTTLLATCAALPAFAQAAPAPGTAGRATIAGSVPGWATASARAGTLDPHTQRHVEVALVPRDESGAVALATAESTPGSPSFRHPISAAEYDARFGPTPTTVDAVTRWLRGQGLRVTGVSANHALIDATGSVASLQTAFGVRLENFHATVRGRARTLVAPDTAVSVPAALSGKVQAVLGLDDSDKTITPAQARVAVPAATATDGTGCSRFWGQVNNAAAPQKYPAGDQSNVLCGYLSGQMRAMYGLTPAATGAGTTVAIVGAYNDTAIVADTDHAAADFGSPQLTAGQYSAFLPTSFDTGDCDVESWHAEQALDVQAVHTVAPGAKIDYYGASDCTSLVSAFTQAVSADQAGVITDSWDYTGETSVPAADRSAFESAAVQAAVQGISVLFSTGDFGDNSTTSGSVSADFPATDPWVTAVGGATVGLDAGNTATVLTGWADTGDTQSGSTWQPLPATQGGFAGGTGGGRSSLYPTPGYQSGLSSAQTGGHRVIPDIAGSADPYTGFAMGYTSSSGFVELSFGGTSEATPLTAGLLADTGQLVGAGGFLGLINPALYRMGSGAITDVHPQQAGVWTPIQPRGSAQGSFLIDAGAAPQSLRSTTGWDNETGMGLPNGGFIAALAAAAAS